MIEDTNFETFLYITNNQYQIFVYDKINSKNLYTKELKINEKIGLNYLSKFLDENIYKIEKIVNGFVKNIVLILENDKILRINISVKKKNYEQYINQKYLENNLKEVKDLFKENYKDQIIMHMIMVDLDEVEKRYSLLNKDISNDHLFLEVNFISISNSLTLIFDKLLENHQIKINKYMSGEYIKSFFDENFNDLSAMAFKLKYGYNKNEIKLVSKNITNIGFFEKFFQLLS